MLFAWATDRWREATHCNCVNCSLIGVIGGRQPALLAEPLPLPRLPASCTMPALGLHVQGICDPARTQLSSGAAAAPHPPPARRRHCCGSGVALLPSAQLQRSGPLAARQQRRRQQQTLCKAAWGSGQEDEGPTPVASASVFLAGGTVANGAMAAAGAALGDRAGGHSGMMPPLLMVLQHAAP